MADTSQWVVGLFYLMAVNVITYVLFFWDKRAAMRGGWRIAEKTLLFWAFLGGSPCAKLAQRVFRHKTRKQPFAASLNLILVFQILLGGALTFPPARAEAMRLIGAIAALN